MSILSDEFYYQHINLDTVNTQVFTNLTSKVGDTNGRGLIVTLTENGLQKDTTGISLNLKWKHRSVVSQGLDNFDVVDLSKGVYKITYPTEMNRSGLVDAFVQIVDSGKVVGTRNMIIIVEPTVGDDSAIESSNSFSALASALIEVQSWNDRIDDVEQDFIDRANNLDATYPTRLVSVEQQLAEIPSVSDTFFGSNEVKFIAHRGLSAIAPENSLPAYELAGKAGFWGAETDAMVTLDGQWVLMHDGTVDRTTDGTGTVGSLTLAQIKAFKIDIGYNIALYPNLRVPTLSEFLFTCKKYNLVPVIEIKDTISAVDFDSFVNLIKTHGFEDKCVVISFYPNTLQEIRNRSKKIMLQPLLAFTEENIAVAKAFGNSGIDVDYTTVTKALVDLAHADGVRVNAWTVNSYQTAKTLIGQGIDFITTDFVTGVI